MEQYFSEKVQDYLKSNILLKPELVSKSVAVDFHQLTSSTWFNKRSNHKNYKIGDFYLNTAIFFETPALSKSFKINMSFNDDSKINKIYDRETGLDFRSSIQPIEEEFYPDLYNNKRLITAKDLNNPIEYNFQYKRNKRNNFVFSQKCLT